MKKQIDIDYPTLNEIFEQLSIQFPEAQVNISIEELKKLSRKLHNIFESMRETDYQGYAKFEHPAPCVLLHRWQNAEIRDERKYYPSDYSSIDISVEKYEEIEIHIVTVWGVKRIELHFISPITDEEKKQLNEDCERADLMHGVLSKLI